jgi:electron transport complex protein RnfG
MVAGRDSFLGQAWLVLVLALVFGGTLAGVQVGLQERIAANQRAETLGEIPALVLGTGVDPATAMELDEDRLKVQLVEGSSLVMQVVEQEVRGHQVFEVIDVKSQRRLGWVARGSGHGYADQIDVLIGLSPDARELTGLYVLSQKETPALGDGITRAPFTDRFVGAPAARPLEVVRDAASAAASPHRILALTAATISSQSVCDIVNRTVADIRLEIER